MGRYELGTQSNKQTFDCENCAMREAVELKNKGIMCYVKDIYKNTLIFDNYFRFKDKKDVIERLW